MTRGRGIGGMWLYCQCLNFKNPYMVFMFVKLRNVVKDEMSKEQCFLRLTSLVNISTISS